MVNYDWILWWSVCVCWSYFQYFVQLFDKEVKSFVYVLDGIAEKSKMQLPNDIKHGCK